MKKIILLVCFIFLTGCKAEYSIIYEDNNLSESLNVVSSFNDNNFKSLVNEYYNNSLFIVDYNIETGDMSNDEIINKYSIYNKSIINKDGIYGLKLNYSYNVINDYKKSFIVHSLFDNFIINDNFFKAYDIKDIFLNYNDLEEIVISFKTDKKVESSNADIVENNIYYWNINKNNYKDKVINITFDNSESNEVNKILNNNSENIIYIILGVLGIGILISVLVIYEKVKKSNK